MKPTLRSALVIAGGAIILMVYFASAAPDANLLWHDPAAYFEQTVNHDKSLVWFLAGTYLFTALGLPRQLPAFWGGYAYGACIGTALSLAVSTASAWTVYLLLERLGGRFISDARLPRLVRSLRTSETDAFKSVLLLRLLPVGSNLITNSACGVAKVPVRAFILATVIGYIPQAVTFALIGSGIRLSRHMQLYLALVLLGMAVFLKRRYGRPRRQPVHASP